MPAPNSNTSPQSSLVGRTKNQQYLSIAQTYFPPEPLPAAGAELVVGFFNIFSQLGNDIQINVPSTNITLAPNKSYFISTFVNTAAANLQNAELFGYLLIDGDGNTPIAADTGFEDVSINIFTTVTTGDSPSTLNLVLGQNQLIADPQLAITNFALNIIQLD